MTVPHPVDQAVRDLTRAREDVKQAPTRGAVRSAMLVLILSLIGAVSHASEARYIFTPLGTLGGNQSEAFGINDSGQVVGYSRLSGDQENHATLWNGTTATDLNNFLDASTMNEGWILSEARGINDNGWIVGYATNSNTGYEHAFLLSIAAVPEPETYGMMLSGIFLLGFMMRPRLQKKESA
jgi:probable HAF family extracellular repeat protein